MKMIVGLGNIGPQYDNTRHNTGFMVVDALAQAHQIDLTTRKMDARYGMGMINGEKVMIVKPTTFMNESGRAVHPLMQYYKVPWRPDRRAR
jgi:Peptidyl-tRNA hydrolase